MVLLKVKIFYVFERGWGSCFAAVDCNDFPLHFESKLTYKQLGASAVSSQHSLVTLDLFSQTLPWFFFFGYSVIVWGTSYPSPLHICLSSPASPFKSLSIHPSALESSYIRRYGCKYFGVGCLHVSPRLAPSPISHVCLFSLNCLRLV